MKTLFCNLCDKEAVSVVPFGGMLLCHTCDDAYRLGLLNATPILHPLPGDMVPKDLEDLWATVIISYVRRDDSSYQILAGDFALIKDTGIGEWVDLDSGQFEQYDHDRLAARLLLKGIRLMEVDLE